MQIPVGNMFVKSIFTSPVGPGFVYVTAYNLLQGLSCGKTSAATIVAFKIQNRMKKKLLQIF